MKHLLHIVCCGVLLLAGIAFGGGVASAHTMPKDEAVLIYPRAQGNMDSKLEFRCGMMLDEVEALLGSDFELKASGGSDFRTVRYCYESCNTVFGSTTAGKNRCPAGELPLGFIECRSPYFHTPSGFSVGEAYAEVEEMFGTGEVYAYDRSQHCYELSDGRVMSFKVDEEGRITEIAVHTPI